MPLDAREAPTIGTGGGDPSRVSAGAATGWRHLVPPALGLSVGVGVAVLVGRTGLAALLAVGGMVLIASAAVVPAVAVALGRAAARLGHVVGRVLTVVLVGLVWLLVITPVALFNRLLGIDVLTSSPARGWLPTVPTRPEGRSYGREPRRAGDRGPRVARAAIVISALVLVGVTVYDRATTVPPAASTPFGGRSTSEPAGPVHDDQWASFSGVPVSRHNFPGEPWGAAVLEFQGSAAPCGVPGADGVPTNFDVTSRYTTVEDGRRRTLSLPGAEHTVWMFGGSTTFGIGQRDEHTIASELVRLGAERGQPIRVVNFGVCNELNWAETDRFEALLRSGTEPPDAAIFLDGVNDWGNGFVREEFGLLDPTVPFTGYRTLEQQEQLLADARARGYVATHDADRQVELVSTQYRAGVERGRALGEEFAVPVVHFWQPALFTTPPTAPGNPTVFANLDLDAKSAQSQGRHYREAMEASGVDPVDLVDIHDAEIRPVFFDCCHTNEHGARVEAAAMYPHLERALAGAG